MAKSTLLLLLMFSLFSCFRKKTPPRNIEDWLEAHFPGRYDVLTSNLKMLDVMAQFKGEKLALVAEKADTCVQFLLDWQKGAESLGIDSAAVGRVHEAAKADVAAAREFYPVLKTAGLEKFSVGVVGRALYIQVFAEPEPALRDALLRRIKKALDERPEMPQTSIFIELMEPDAFETEFHEIIPQGHWQTGTGWQRQQKIMALDFERTAGTDIRALSRHWALNPESKRCGDYHAEAFRSAQEWANRSLKQPFFLPEDQLVSFELTEEGPPGIRYGFPYYDQPPAADSEAEPAGYVCGWYYADQPGFTGIRAQKEF